MKVDAFRLVQVESFPRPMDAGILYHSERFKAAGHACACGCGQEVITPLSPVQWRLTQGVDGATLRPSIGNWRFPCRSHYWITGGRVEWAADMSEEKIKAGRAFNAKLRERYFDEKNSRDEPPAAVLSERSQEPKRGLLHRLIAWLNWRTQ